MPTGKLSLNLNDELLLTHQRLEDVHDGSMTGSELGCFTHITLHSCWNALVSKNAVFKFPVTLVNSHDFDA